MPDLDSAALREAATYVDRWIALRRELRDIPGLVVAVRHADDMLLLKAYGLAQLDPPVPMTTGHIFRIASHSKTFTATAIMQLVEAGKVRLDDRVSAYVDWLESDVTVRQLMNHAGGIIRDGIDADFWRVEQPFPDVAAVRALAPDIAIQPPNTSFKYSNIAYALLGLVIEGATGSAYNQYVTDHIVTPLGLRDTGPEFRPALAERMVTGYTAGRLGVPRWPVPNIDTRALSPATGFYSTAGDLCGYAAAHWFGDQSLLSDASKREMQHPAWEVDQSEERYGLGFGVQSIGSRQMVGHGGGFPGQSTRTLFHSDDRLVVVVLSNTSALEGLAAPLATQIVRIIDFAQERARNRGKAAEWPLDRYTGRFANIGGVADIMAFGNSLVGLSSEADEPVHFVTDLEVVDEDTLRIAKTGGYGSQGELVRYERDARGAAVRVIIGGVSSYPEDIFRQRYAAQPIWRQ